MQSRNFNQSENRSRFDRNQSRDRREGSRPRESQNSSFRETQNEGRNYDGADRDYDEPINFDRQEFENYGSGGMRYGGEPERSWGGQNNRTYGSESDSRSFERESDSRSRYGYGRDRDTSNSSSLGGSQTSGGKFRGKGPKSFKRSDDRIMEDVCRCLQDHDEIDASEIDVSVNDGIVTLKGTIEGRREKRMAEEIVENLWGVKDVKNEIRVQSQSSSQANEPTSSTQTYSPMGSPHSDTTPRKPKAA